MTTPQDTTSSSTSNANTSANSITYSSIPQIQVHHLISVKLDNENYLLWLAQFQPLLQGYDLEGYVDGNHPCPARLLPDSTEINPSYTAWMKHDKILLGWLLSSLTESVLAQVVGLTTSRAVWESLKKHYSSQSQARTLYLKRELQNMRKGNKTMAEYYLHAKQLADKLAASGQAISSTDLQHMMLSGLDSSYDAIVTVLTATVAELHMDDFYSNLLAFDMRIDAQQANFPPPAAHIAHRGASNSSQPSSGPRDKSRFQGTRYRGSNKPQSRSSQNRTATSTCQICSRKNHTAPQCWYRFDKNYSMASSTSETPPAAYVAAPGNWIPNSGATHHLTSDLRNLHIQNPYDGPDSIQIGNGSNHGEATAARHE